MVFDLLALVFLDTLFDVVSIFLSLVCSDLELDPDHEFFSLGS